MDLRKVVIDQNRSAPGHSRVDHGLFAIHLFHCSNQWSPINFFRPTRGLNQGCPFSPFIFLFIAEALSRIIHKAKENRVIKGIKVSNYEEVKHTLFVDDVLIFGEGSIRNIEAFISLIDKYKSSTGMVVNMDKSNLIQNDFPDDI